MNCRIPALLLLSVLMTFSVQAELLPPPIIGVGSSSDARFLVRLDSKIQLFTLSDDEKSYRLVTEIAPLGFHSAKKGLVSKDGSYVIAFECVISAETEKGDDVVCVYSSRGERISKWRLAEILSKEDLEEYAPTHGGTRWWDYEVGLGGDPETVVIVGPTDTDELIERRYSYIMDLKTRVWRRLGDQVLSKRPNSGGSASPQREVGPRPSNPISSK